MDYNGARRFLDTLPDWELGNPHTGPLEDYLPRTRALLTCLDEPQRGFRTIRVGGTNGKGTVSSLTAALLHDAGYRTGLFISPHLHTLRERIQVDGQLLSKDAWAAGVATLFDRTRALSGTPHGSFSKFEALTVLAAHLFAAEGVEVAVFEVGLGGRCDATNAWDADTAILTSIALDHVDILGNDVVSIAAEKLCIARPGRPLLTTSTQPTEVLAFLQKECAQLGIPLGVTDEAGVGEGSSAAAARRRRPYSWSPPLLPLRPRSYVDNARLAIAAFDDIAASERGPCPAERVRHVVESHRWPGRFEVARQEPLTVLDGAHNPAGAVALAADLRALEAAEWTLVVGVNAGHDAVGILQALGPLAHRCLLTASDHPKAIAPDKLRDLAPDRLEVELTASVIDAIKAATAQAETPVCITGSLSVVARAREYLNLRYEREGISEEVAMESLVCVETACRRVGLDYERVSENSNVLCVQAPAGPLYFLRNKHPFNDYVTARLAEDKGYQHELFTQAGLPVPHTMQVFNPYADDRFNRYKTHRTVAAMVADIEGRLPYPLLVKKYRSSVSQGVYLERSGEELGRRLQGLFEHSGFLDNTVLIQEFVEGPELRAVASRGELLLAYEKQGDGTDAGSDLNPLHGSTGMAVKVEDGALLAELGRLCTGIAAVLSLGLYAVDLILTRRGPAILELNPNPFCHFYNLANGREDFVGIYERLLRHLVNAGECSEAGEKQRLYLSYKTSS